MKGYLILYARYEAHLVHSPNMQASVCRNIRPPMTLDFADGGANTRCVLGRGNQELPSMHVIAPTWISMRGLLVVEASSADVWEIFSRV